jgi:hypothetical protein
MERETSPGHDRRAKSESRVPTERVAVGPRRSGGTARAFATVVLIAILAYAAASLYGYLQR